MDEFSGLSFRRSRQAEGTVWIDGKEAKYKFRGDSGDLLLTESAEADGPF
jgi:hypothetical protein